MKLVSLNIEKNKHYDVILEFLKKENPDVICLQEVLETDFDYLKKELKMQGVLRPFKYEEIDPRHPGVGGKKQSVAIFAKNISDFGFIFYEGREDNTFKTHEECLQDKSINKNGALLWLDFKDKKGVLFKIFTTHLPVTMRGESTPYQLEVVNSMIAKLESFPQFILCGDMNAPRGGETFNRLAKKYKDNIPAEYKASIDFNIHRNGKNMIMENPMLMVDGLFTTSAYKASNVRLVDGVSDHMAVIAHIEKVL